MLFKFNTDPDAGDMFEEGNWRRRKRMKRSYRNAPYAKGIYGEHFQSAAAAAHHMTHIGARNIFSHHSPPAYGSASAYPRYERYSISEHAN